MEKFRKIIRQLLYIMVVLLSIAVVKINNNVNNLKSHHLEVEGYSYPIDCVKEAELSYWEYKAQLTHEVQNYINTIAPTSNLRAYAIIDECESYNVDVIFVLTQAQLESHFGTKGIGSKLNNVFNVGVFDGLSHEKVNKNYKYDYPNESIKPYLELLTTRYLVQKTEEDLMNKYVDINGKRYASDTHYEERFKSQYNYIKSNTKIEELQNIVKSYAIKCNR